MSTSSATFPLPSSPPAPPPSPDPPVGRGTGSAAAAAPVSDVLLFHTFDGGEITFTGGEPRMSDGLYTSTYLSLFGGNQDDGRIEATDRLQWWGNLGEPDEAKTYRSETQYLLRVATPIPANLRRVEDGASRDLAWMLDEVASRVEVSASMPSRNRVDLAIAIEIDTGTKYEFQFQSGWGVAPR